MLEARGSVVLPVAGADGRIDSEMGQVLVDQGIEFLFFRHGEWGKRLDLEVVCMSLLMAAKALLPRL